MEYRKLRGLKPDDPLETGPGSAFWGEMMRRYRHYLSALQGVPMFGADLRGADLGSAFLPGADLRAARIRGANLFRAQMPGANLFKAQMQGTDLRGAQMQDADCSRATLAGALLQSANVTYPNLKQAQLAYAVGDFRTVLPHGLTVASCLETLPEDVEAALAHHPEEGSPIRRSRAEFRDALLCAEGEKPHATGSWPFERRYWIRQGGIRPDKSVPVNRAHSCPGLAPGPRWIGRHPHLLPITPYTNITGTCPMPS